VLKDLGMKREVSWAITAAVGLAALIGISNQHASKPEVNTSEEPAIPTPAPGLARESKTQFEQGPCTEIEKHLQAFLLEGKTESLAAPLSCYGGISSLPKGEEAFGKEIRERAKDLNFVIATLPDPAYSDFSLTFDRYTEAIQEGASDDEYVYDSSWLPWDMEATSYALIEDQDRANERKKRQEEQPGILLFRRKLLDQGAQSSFSPFGRGLVVFIVGEEPTEGIDRIQFENAAAWIAALQPPRDAKRSQYKLPNGGILGPSFSGSLPSLAALLDEIAPKSQQSVDPAASAAPFHIYSGAVSGRNGVQWFVNVAGAQHNLRFESFVQNDDVLLDEYCRYLKASAFHLRQLAILSEDETAYGAETKTKPQNETSLPTKTEPPNELDKTGDSAPFPACYEKEDGRIEESLRVYYPRGIAAVRTAYQEQSIFNSEGSESSPETGKRTLSTNIADTEGQQHDTIRNYNTKQMPQSQEGVLQQIVSQLRVHQTEYVVLRSSNPLDQLFLAHYLRLAYPHGRIVILGADVLLRRESGAARLSGIMTLTTYPLLPWEPHWTRNLCSNKYHSHRIFPQDYAEGIYVATRFLLNKDDVGRFIHEGQHITMGELIDQLYGDGYSDLDKLDPAEMTPARAYRKQDKDLMVYGRYPQDEVTIHIEGDKVTSHNRGDGTTPSTFELEISFLPTFKDSEDPKRQIENYSTPFWIRAQEQGTVQPPPVWLSVLGRDDFWPLAAMNTGSVPSSSVLEQPGAAAKQKLRSWIGNATANLINIVFFPGAKSAYDPGCKTFSPWPAMPVSMRIALFVLFVWAIFHLTCCTWPSITSRPGHRAYFVCFAHNCGSHRALLVIASLALSSAATVFAAGFGVMSSDGVPLPHAGSCAFMLLALWIIPGAALATNVWKQRSVRPASKKDKKKRADKPAPPVQTEAPSAAPCEATTGSQPRSQSGLRWKHPVLDRLRAALSANWPFLWPLLGYVVGTAGFYYWLYYVTERRLILANRIPTYWRAMNLTSSVSPVLPLAALAIGVYLWIWRCLQGLAFFGPDAPLLPPKDSLKFPGGEGKKLDWLRMFSQEDAGRPVLEYGRPFKRDVVLVGIGLFFLQIIVANLLGVGSAEPIRSLGARSYAVFVCLLIGGLVSVMLASTWQLMQVWFGLRRLLLHLDRIPLRRSMAAIPGVSWGSVWKISGNVLEMRYKLLVNQLESVKHFENALRAAEKKDCAFWEGDFDYLKIRGIAGEKGCLPTLHDVHLEFKQWYARIWDQRGTRNQQELKDLQQSLAEFAGQVVVWVLLPAWRLEKEDLLAYGAAANSEKKDENKDEQLASAAHLAPHIRSAEQLVCYVYLGFIQNILGRMRTLVVGILWLFLAATISLACYPFDPRPVVNAAMVSLFLVLGTAIVFVYAQMHRDTILSTVTNTKPGELDSEFWIKLVSFGAGPVLALLATIFPELTDFLFSWVAPGISSIK
jgi:hypothetical protein